MNALEMFARDRARYRSSPWLGRFWWLAEPNVWAIAVFRLGTWLRDASPARLRGAAEALIIPFTTAAQVLTGIEIPVGTRIGPGLRIHHGQGIVINGAAVIGRGCELRQGVCIGNLEEGGPSPTVGDDVTFGTYAQVFGDIHIGDGAKIGSHAVVLKDVPAGATAVGVPARIIPKNGLRTDL